MAGGAENNWVEKEREREREERERKKMNKK